MIISKSIIPIGFQYNDSDKFPFKMERIDLVEPHEGQGILVTCFMIQTPMSLLLLFINIV